MNFKEITLSLIFATLIKYGCQKKCKVCKKDVILLSMPDTSFQEQQINEEISSSSLRSIFPRTFKSSNSGFNKIYKNKETAANNESLWSGDIILNPEQEDVIIHHADNADFASARKDVTKWWTKGKVFYKILEKDTKITGSIKRAMERWSNYTCVEFIDAFNLTVPFYFQVKKTGSGCYSFVGMVNPGQLVSLDEGCETVETVAHEIGHALGMWHEHTRPDREEHFFFHLENVDKRQKKNFDIPTDIIMASSPYDVTSVMHYDFYAFTSNNRMTMVPKNPLIEAEMHNAEKPSFHDYVLINKIYNCDEPCMDSPLKCLNGGYRTSNKVRGCFCLCKEGYIGKNCERKTSKILCGGKFETSTIISTPNFPKPLPPNIKCVYWLLANKGKKSKVEFFEFNLQSADKNDECLEEYLQIRNKDIFSDDPGEVYCGKELSDQQITSAKEDLVLVLRTGNSNSSSGFQALFTII